MSSLEVELISARSNPKEGHRPLSIRIQAKYVVLREIQTETAIWVKMAILVKMANIVDMTILGCSYGCSWGCY